MKAARGVVALGVALAATVLTWLGWHLWVGRGGLLPVTPWGAVAATFVLAVAVVAAGWPIRTWRRAGQSKWIDPIVAARTVVLAKAAVYGGAALLGWYLGQVLVLASELAEVRWQRVIAAAIAGVGAAVVCGAGFVVQRWCRVDPDQRR